MSVKYKLGKNKNQKSTGYGKWYARFSPQGILTLKDLAAHMAGHNSIYSEGNIYGLLTDMVNCVRELTYDGYTVKLDNLGLFRVGIRSKGVSSAKDFNASSDITARWVCRATGDSRIAALPVTRAAGSKLVFEEEKDYNSPRSTATGQEGGNA